MNELDGTTAIVTGASRGFGRAIAAELAAAGANVVGIARNRAHLDLVREELGDKFEALAADAADPAVAGRAIAKYRPRTIVLAAGLAPRMAALADQTWDTFTENWNVDVAQAFHWVQAALRLPLAPGSTVIAMSSGAAVNGSPLSGGYAGAKATVRFIASYAAQESARAGLGIEFVSLLPRLTPATDLGAKAVAAYAERQGIDIDAYLEAFGPILTPEQVGRSVRDIASNRAEHHDAYLLTAAGSAPLR